MRRNRKWWFNLIAVLIFVTMSISTVSGISVSAKKLTDVQETDWFYEDVNQLVSLGIVDGYSDGTFRPYNTVKVSEFLKMAFEAGNVSVSGDIGPDWYTKYVVAGINQGIFTTATFNDYERPITRSEMGFVIDGILQLDFDNKYLYSEFISDYNEVLDDYIESSLDIYISGIITGYDDGSIHPNSNANRAEAGTVIIRMINESRRQPPDVDVKSLIYEEEDVEEVEEAIEEIVEDTSGYFMDVSVNGIYIGMSKAVLLSKAGNPDEILTNQFGYEWYVYPNNYNNFMLVGVKAEKVVSFFSNQSVTTTSGVGIGSGRSTVSSFYSISKEGDYYSSYKNNYKILFFIDENRDDTVEGIYVSEFSNDWTSSFNDATIRGYEKAVFHIINGERVKLGVNALLWSEQARIASYKHSLDMATNSYFAHESLDGRLPWDRMKDENVSGSYYGENIAAGYETPFTSHYALMHSPGHYTNIMSDKYSHIGVGLAYSASATYRYYITENFYQSK